MASYVYNPSAKVTEFLSKFLEFDPESLQMGIWSGDLSVKNVNLRRDAVKPLLNRKPNPANSDPIESLYGGSTEELLALNSSQDPMKKDPLRVKLVKGTIGHLRVRIPWKQLVWGPGTVQVEVSDVEIVLSLQSREETAREDAMEEKLKESDLEDQGDATDAEKKPTSTGKRTKKKDGRSAVYHKAYREAKQKRLREAERRQLNNSAELGPWLEQLHQKQSIGKEAHRVEQKELGTSSPKKSSSRYAGTPASSSTPAPPPKEGNFDRYLKKISSDFFWRLFAGVKGNISKARIVLLQDGVEVGCIVQSIEVLAGKDGIESLEISSHPSNSHNSNQNSNPAAATATSNSSGGVPDGPIDKLPLVAPFDDGEHIDKVLKQSGIGIFVRRETNRKHLSRIPNELRFSTSVEADDYILRPVAALNIGLSFFYPHPPERRKKIPAAASTAATTATPSTAASTTDPGVGATSIASTATSGKRRRGKRDKEKPPPKVDKPPKVSNLPFIETNLPNDEPIRPHGLETPGSAFTYFSDPRLPLEDVAALSSPALDHDYRKTRTPSKTTDSDSYFSDPREALEGTPPSADRRGRLRRTKSGSSSKKPRRARLKRSRSADNDDLFGTSHRDDMSETRSGASLSGSGSVLSGGGTDRRNKLQRFRTPLRGSKDPSMMLPTPLKRGSTYPKPMTRATSSATALSNMHGSSGVTTAAESYTPTLLPDLPSTPCPRLQVRVGLDEVQVVFTNRHYELLNYLFSTVARMKNGRPDRTIRSVKVTEPGSELKELLKHKADAQQLDGKHGDIPDAASGSESRYFSSYLWTSSADVGKDNSAPKAALDGSVSGSFADGSTLEENLLYLRGKQLKSARQEVVAKWWQYAIGAIKFEIRKRKHMTSAFRKMYISFDWKKQRHRRQEYINAFIAKLERKNIGNSASNSYSSPIKMGSNSSRMINMLSASIHNDAPQIYIEKTLEEIEALLEEIEDELPIEQILLYRSIARSMRIRGATKMPICVYELWGEEGLTSAEIVRRKQRLVGRNPRSARYPVPRIGSGRVLNTTFESNGSVDNLSADDFVEGDDDGLLAQIQGKFEATRKLRCKHGVQDHFAREANKLDEAQTVESPAAPESEVMQVETMKKPSKAAIEAGRFYASNAGKKDISTIGDLRSRTDGRTIRSNRLGRSTQSRTMTASTSGDVRVTRAADVRMRLFFSFQIKKFNLIVVEEKGLRGFAPNLDEGLAAPSNRLVNPDASSVRDESSVLSELSVLTDDQRFFGDQTSESNHVVEEEEDFDDLIGRPHFKSTDYLSFGKPDNPLLRLTISSFSASSKGISGGGMEIGMSVGRIEAAGDGDSHILSIGPVEPSMPVYEVDIEGAREDSMKGKLDQSSKSNGLVFTQRPALLSRHAILLKFSKNSSLKTLQCDLSKIEASANIESAEKLLRFYSRPNVKHPEDLLSKTSRDVARKIMVKKISNNGKSNSLANISSMIRIHGIEVKMPFSYIDHQSDSDDSDLDSFILSGDSGKIPVGSEKLNCATILELESFEFFSGIAVDELVQSAALMVDAMDRSVGSGTQCCDTQSLAPVRTMELLDIAELTSSHDSFASRHFVVAMRGVSCKMESATTFVPQLMENPVSIEVLVTSNEMSILDTENPKQQIVVEVSPVHFLMSKHRLQLLTATQHALQFRNRSDGEVVLKKKILPDPPRIEMLSQRILSSLDLNCHRVRIEFVKDKDVGQATLLPPKMKELVMEETLSDFLSIVACFDLNLPNEEALSSAMQVCIGRLVGLGMNDDEAWNCTNQARMNFLDDIARMRQAQSDLLEVMSQKISDASSSSNRSSAEDSEDSGSTGGDISDNDGFSDDDTNNSVQMVEATISNAVERTVSSFSTFLRSFFEGEGQMDDSTYLYLDLPLGFSFSSISMFYDHHLTALIPTFVATNKAGIELLTLVPKVKTEASFSKTEENERGIVNHGISFSRFNLDEDNGFGSGGLPMSVLASDKGAETDQYFRQRSRFDDLQLGELEFFFSYSIFEEIIDEFSLLFGNESDDTESNNDALQVGREPVTTSTVVIVSSLSLLFTSEALVPFCRLTMENMCYKNRKAMEILEIPEMELPSFAIVASVFLLQNLCPEGQFYPDVLSPLSHDSSTAFPFQIRYFGSSDSWKISSRLEIDFTSVRLFLVRQFINDLLRYFAYDEYGVGKLRKKYESNEVDIHGNGKPPLLYSVFIYDSSIICPRNSNSTDMVAFEIDDACFALSYVPETFAMPTESSPFWENPPTQGENNPDGAMSTTNSFISVSDYEDCESFLSKEDSGPVSSYSNNLKRRFKINLDRIEIFTALAGDKTTQTFLNSPLFRFIHTMNGRAAKGKEVYKKQSNIEHNLKSEDNIFQFKNCIQSWEEMSANPFSLEILFDAAPHTRILISSDDGLNPLAFDAKLSQLCLLLSVWDSNMQEIGTMFPMSAKEIFEGARPPVIPESFPKYSSSDFVSYLDRIETCVRSEICCMFKKLSFRCTFDEPGFFSIDPNCFQYFEDPECADKDKPALILSFEDMVIHVLNNDLNVKRIGIGSSAINLTDGRKASLFQSTLSSDPGAEGSKHQNTWADLSWGLREDARTLDSSLPQPVQCSIFMTPGWSLINFGIESANATMHDLSWLWVLMDYFKSYYSNEAFGNLGYEAQKWSHRMKNALRRSANEDTKEFESPPGLNIDFRVWLSRPIICLPSHNYDPQAPSIVLSSETGLWYRYKSLTDLSSQEVVSTDLNLSFANEYISPDNFRRQRNNSLSRSTGPTRPLIQGLSFGLLYECNNKFHHKDVSVSIPFEGDSAIALSVDGEELEITPVQLDAPTVLKPFYHRKRNFGPKACDVTCLIELLPIASATMMNFLSGPYEVNEKFSTQQDENPPQTLSLSANLSDIRLIVIDPDLGVQLPIAVLSLASSSLTMSKFAVDPITDGQGRGESQPADMQIIFRNNLWADYFKLGLTRSWEPLLEPFEFEVLYETSHERGQGYSIKSDCPLHINLSGALLSILSETIDSFDKVVKDTFGKKDEMKEDKLKETLDSSFKEEEGGTHLRDSINRIDGQVMDIIHEIPKQLKAEDKVAFSLRNLTGQRIRIHQQSNFSNDGRRPVVVTYLNQGESSGLTFAATISVVKNLRIVEVPYPGFEVSKDRDKQQQGSLNHAIDLQVPGCRWIQGVRVDSFGRKFEWLTPRSSHVSAKISNDWRLRNAMTLLTEVGPDNGGRLLSIRSIFEVRNNTSHSVKLIFHPDPKHKPNTRNKAIVDIDGKGFKSHDEEKSNSFEQATIESGANFQLPTLLMESALEMDGSHLGSVWIRPETSNPEIFAFRDFSKPTGSKVEKFDASFSSRPVQLAKVVHETSRIYTDGQGKDIDQSGGRSGVQVSCATHSQNEKVGTPFCYAIEIVRSPIVKSKVTSISSSTAKDDAVEKNKKKRKTDYSSLMHGPVAYTLAIHAPLVIVNILPEGGRFELMHAIKKTVVWYADLEPGQQVPIHSLGLDVPLLLLVNLGFCRTPIGEGALVHHGGETTVGSKVAGAGLKSLGKAVTKGTRKIGRTLTTITDSANKRAQERVAKVITPKAKKKKQKKGNVKHMRTSVRNESLGLDIESDRVGGKVHAIEGMTYSADDIADETTVVDSIGQRLTLRIENVRGGGGQRRISLYCPYWIVNTTEHALRYREEKEKSYVCGTILSPVKDGSMPVDGSNRQYRARYDMISRRRAAFHSLDTISYGAQRADTPLNPETIFAGTHGALATAPGRCTLSPEYISSLIDQDIPLEELSKIAFMFNFHEDGMGGEKLVVQLFDGLRSSENKRPDYTSGWSIGFGLETVGISQVIRIPCKDGRMLELSASVNVAPGFLSGYTKIVRLSPRYAIYNRLERPIRLWQDSSIARSLDEDRSDATNQSGATHDLRKWRYTFEDKRHGEKISQYESIFGRHSVLNDEHFERHDQSMTPIPEGTSAHRAALYISSVGPSQLSPFFLPDTRSDSQLRIDVGGPWNLTPSFASDIPGEYVLPIARATDIRMLKHVSVRDAPKYKVILPPSESEETHGWDGELGAYFETEWVNEGDRKILVKGTKRGKYAFNHTDMRVGDELLRINGISVLKMTFQEAMDTIKSKLTEIRAYEEMIKEKENAGIANSRNTNGVLRRLTLGVKPNALTNNDRSGSNGVLRRLSMGVMRKSSADFEGGMMKPSQLTLTFRTQEERLRKLRMKAIKSRNSVTTAAENLDLEPIDALTVETKALHNTMFVILRHVDKENPPFKIQNRSLRYFLFYRQRNCDEHKWNTLAPGESRSYCWEEPMKSKKLTVRIALDPHEPAKDSFEKKSVDSEPDEVAKAVRADRLKQILAYQYVANEERGGLGPATTVRLEEIGFQIALPVPMLVEGGRQNTQFLNCEVDTDGGTRLLVVSDVGVENDERQKMHLNLENLDKQILQEERRIATLEAMRSTFPVHCEGKQIEQKEREFSIENELRELVDDFPEGNSIAKRCQVVVQVLEAVGLTSSDLVGNCNPYCEVFYKGKSRSRKHFLQKRKNKRNTYFVEKASNPKWNDQNFVFDVPEAAIESNRGHSIKIIVRDFRSIGQHPILGQASVYFASIQNQQELVGWWPLVGKYTNADVSEERISDLGRGSIKLRAQWVYTIPAMVDYISLLSQRRLTALTKTQKGMQEQLQFAEDSFQRKREAIDRIPGGGISKLVNLRRRALANRDAALKRELSKKERKLKAKSALNTNFLNLKEALKITRDRSMNTLTLETIESKRKRQLVLDEIKNSDVNLAEVTRPSKLSSGSSISVEKDAIRKIAALSRDRTKSLGDFFAHQRGSLRSKRNSEWNVARLKSHRKLSLDFDDQYLVEAMMEARMIEVPGDPDSDVGRIRSQTQDSETSNTSVGADVHEQARRKNDIARLKALGFVFHESGILFHENHLPNHFRRLLFASSLERSEYPLYCNRKFFVGTSSSIRQLVNWQAASALFYDSEMDVLETKKSFRVKLNGKISTTDIINGTAGPNASKNIISQKLAVPDDAPDVSIRRSKTRIEAMYLSRTQFDRTYRRILGCVLNPGGWLTIRPIVAMNLPDSYNGMYIKVSHGSQVQASETVDAKVSPKWSSKSTLSSTSRVKGRKRTYPSQQPDTVQASNFQFSENDLHMQVEPQQTGGSIRLSVVALQHKNKVELGVVNIPIGTAIAACIDAAQKLEVSGKNATPMYTRWFPLMEPQLTVPFAGDMGFSSRSTETEQNRDHMFQYAPCIQLSLMWWPREQNLNDMEDQVDAKSDKKRNSKGKGSVVSEITRIPAIKTFFNANISTVSLALIDSTRAVELLNLSLREIDVKYAVTRSKTRIGLVVGWIQIDQQNDNSRESVVLAPTPTDYLQPTLQFLALKDNLRTKSNIVSYEYVGVALQEMDLLVDETSIYELWDFFMNVMARKRMRERTKKGQRHANMVSRSGNVFSSFELDDASPPLFEVLQRAGNRGSMSRKKKMYVEQLILGLVKVNLSYLKGKKQTFDKPGSRRNTIQNLSISTGSGQMRDRATEKNNEHSEIFTRWSQLTSGEDGVWGGAGVQNNLPSIIAALFPSVSDAPIRLQGKLVEHVFESPTEIASSLKNYYTNETLKQVYKIIGSLDFVGNPTILLSSFMSGVKDLVSIPTAAFMKSPANVKEVGIGVGKGTVSFLSHSASGFFGFSARLLSQAGQGVAFFSFDPEYRQWHRDRVVNEATNLERTWKRRGMPTAEEMFLRPLADLVLGVTLGVSGVVLSPYRGARKKGVKGFVKGTGRGVAGIVTKPIVGVLDMMTHGSQSIHDIAKTVNFLERRRQPVLKLRLPHVFGPMKILTPFDAVSARSVYLLELFPSKTKLKRKVDKEKELHVHSEVLHMEPGVETYAIVTTTRVLLIKLRRGTTSSLVPIFGWEAELASGATVSSQISDHGHNGVALTITTSFVVVQTQTGKLSKKVSEMTMKTRKVSTASSHSFVVDLEGKIEDEVAGELGDNFHLIHPSANPSSSKPLNDPLSAGVTKTGNKTLEWFTVLAEYQQRNQLTRLHNVICCIVGDYDSIIVESTQFQSSFNANEALSFGIFNFEKGLPDGSAAKFSNTQIVASLENLYWMESKLAQRINKISSPDRKQRALNKVQNSWDFSDDMKASEHIGGPDWLIVARAKAMCTRTESKDSEISSSNEMIDGCREDKHFFPEKNSPLQIVSPANRVQLSNVLGASTLSEVSPGQSSVNMVASLSNQEQSVSSNYAYSQNTTALHTTVTSHRQDQSADVFHDEIVNAVSSQNNRDITEDFFSPINGVELNRDDQHQPPVPSLYLPNAPEQNQDGISPSHETQSRTAPNTISMESTRLDRLEGVMEQLLILNASQAHRDAASSEARASLPEISQTGSLADTLMQELTEIREKMDRRAREDEALREEIGMLRDQLAEKRSTDSRSDAGTSTGNQTIRRPPPINTQFLKKNPIRGIFNNRKKSKKQRQVPDENIGNNDRDDSNENLPSMSIDHQNLPSLGTDDEQTNASHSLI